MLFPRTRAQATRSDLPRRSSESSRTRKNMKVTARWERRQGDARATPGCRLEKLEALAGLDVSLYTSPQIAPI